MQSERHRNVVHHGVYLLLLVSMLILLAIPKSFFILKEFLYTSIKKPGEHSRNKIVNYHSGESRHFRPTKI